MDIYVAFVLTIITLRPGQPPVKTIESYVAPDYTVCTRWRNELHRSIKGGPLDRKDLAIMTGCEFRKID